ncbi:MAG: reverse transcriptase-like protein [Candidatus Omnitrophica bacterium]|nr:reverse transcriptase-like protein [Candidatus Omnitrophota bacterium]MBD3269415.1 reverse transcriptase-like protein [Candidatus Omnitrophota bacterium]
MIKIYIDGSSIGNPGKVGIGYLIYKDTKILKKEGIYLGIQSNNFAEYMALIFPLIELLNMGHKECDVFTDSNLLCQQIKGNFKVKNQNIYPLFVLAKRLIAKMDKFDISHINRENNREADNLAKSAAGFLT